MKISRYITIALSALILAGCSSDDNDIAIKSNEMQFAASLPETRVTATNFEKGDKMGVYVTQYNEGETAPVLQFAGNYANNIATEYNGTTWKCLTPIFWKEGNFDVYAYYPYGKPNSIGEYKFKVATDQSSAETAETLGGYESSDFLFARAIGIQKMDIVPLKFRHCMSKFVVDIVKGPDYEGALPDDMKVFIHNTVTSSTIDLASGVVTKEGRGIRETITANKKSVDKYEAIVVPQYIDNKLPLIEIVSQGVSYLVESRFVFKAGIEHIFKIVVNGSPNQMKIEIGGEIEGGWQ